MLGLAAGTTGDQQTKPNHKGYAETQRNRSSIFDLGKTRHQRLTVELN
jgi:hypothetical protein